MHAWPQSSDHWQAAPPQTSKFRPSCICILMQPPPTASLFMQGPCAVLLVMLIIAIQPAPVFHELAVQGLTLIFVALFQKIMASAQIDIDEEMRVCSQSPFSCPKMKVLPNKFLYTPMHASLVHSTSSKVDGRHYADSRHFEEAVDLL